MSFLFDSQISYSSDNKGETKLPFSIFALTQQGLQHRHWSIGNQDSGSVYVGKTAFIGAIADGCTSGTNLNGKSNNQVGAYVSSYLAVRILRKLVIKRKVPFDELLRTFEQEFALSLAKLIRALSPWKFERKGVISNLLVSTVVVFLITEKEFLVANCGDGFVAINGELSELIQHSGRYFAQNLYDIRKNPEGAFCIEQGSKFNEIASGRTDELDSLFLATDGFPDRDIVGHPQFSHFFFDELDGRYSRGFINRRGEFRKEFVAPMLQMKNGRKWPEDDATFISIRRVS